VDCPVVDPGSPVTVQYYKFPDTLHWRHDAIMLGADGHGVWLGAPAGATIQRGREAPISWPTPFVQLVPHSGWYTVIGNPRTSTYALYVDITTDPQWVTRDRVEMIDVDLDVVLDWNGHVSLLDEDEFVAHQSALDYPEWLVDRARASAAAVVLAVESGTEPFGTITQRWLERLAKL